MTIFMFELQDPLQPRFTLPTSPWSIPRDTPNSHSLELPTPALSLGDPLPWSFLPGSKILPSFLLLPVPKDKHTWQLLKKITINHHREREKSKNNKHRGITKFKNWTDFFILLLLRMSQIRSTPSPPTFCLTFIAKDGVQPSPPASLMPTLEEECMLTPFSGNPFL